LNVEIAIMGTGGQGVLVIGRLLAEAGFLEDREVVWLPSYGAEKRGGTVSCYVTIADEKIGSLVIDQPSCAIAMNQVASITLETAMKRDGVLVINRSLAPDKVLRKDIHAIYVPANQLAIKLGSDSVANIVALGALVAICPVVAKTGILYVMDRMFARNPKSLELNKQAFEKGFSYRSTHRTPKLTSTRCFVKSNKSRIPDISY
jgi:2-oxoglutarate ferredoxin oxidoreductase subunit gamma